MKNKQLAISAIRKGCQLRERYYDPETKRTCAIGCLALLAGVSKKDLRLSAGIPIHCSGAPSVLREAISCKFGLSAVDQIKIQVKNDNEQDLEIRRALIIKFLESLPE